MYWTEWQQYGPGEWAIAAFGVVAALFAFWMVWLVFGIVVMLALELLTEVVKFLGLPHEPWKRFSLTVQRCFQRITPGI